MFAWLDFLLKNYECILRVLVYFKIPSGSLSSIHTNSSLEANIKWEKGLGLSLECEYLMAWKMKMGLQREQGRKSQGQEESRECVASWKASGKLEEGMSNAVVSNETRTKKSTGLSNLEELTLVGWPCSSVEHKQVCLRS